MQINIIKLNKLCSLTAPWFKSKHNIYIPNAEKPGSFKIVHSDYDYNNYYFKHFLSINNQKSKLAILCKFSNSLKIIVFFHSFKLVFWLTCSRRWLFSSFSRFLTSMRYSLNRLSRSRIFSTPLKRSSFANFWAKSLNDDLQTKNKSVI